MTYLNVHISHSKMMSFNKIISILIFLTMMSKLTYLTLIMAKITHYWKMKIMNNKKNISFLILVSNVE